MTEAHPHETVGTALDGRVAIITGAGRGIGREHALFMARQGATVLVNDLGGANDGTGQDAGPAQEVVDEILAFGGLAVANTDDVATWAGAKAMVEQAIDEFGRLDVLVNNAGILRDAFVAGITEEQYDAVINVHLKGHFATLHHAAAYWKDKSKAGEQIAASVINTASASGTFMVNPAQANYGAAKAGISALTLVAAAELGRYGVRVNAVAPIARTRLTLSTPGMGEIFAAEVPEGEFDVFGPQNIAPVVGYLATEKCTITGQVFGVQGGAIQRMQGWTITETVETSGPWRLEDLPDQLAAWA
jgi:NAD(P)-dependent dehydrogenase (short-subunit alcohol dehydrogenase family)